jgi:hypothetical protein
MDKREKRLSANLVAGAACTAIALVGGLFFVAAQLDWVPADFIEPIESVIVGVIGISLAAFSLWFVIRWLNRRDDPVRRIRD